jgi:outer membrane protein assembly factor BamB
MAHETDPMPARAGFPRRHVILGWLGIGMVAHMAWAQLQPPEGVYVDDSFEANELLERAKRSADAEQWDQAVRHLTEIMDQFDGKVVAEPEDRYISIQRRIARVVGDWPDAGQAAYTRRFEPALRAALHDVRAARDTVALGALINRYFCCPLALEAADELGQHWLESGAFGRAQAIYERLLREHPLAERHRTHLLGRMVICSAFAGNWASVDATMAATGTDLDDHAIQWQGQPRPIKEVLDQLRASPISPIPPNPPITSTAWPVLGGAGDRNRIPDMAALPNTPLWVFSEFAPTTLAKQDGYFQGSSYRAALERGKFLAFQPVLMDSRVLFCDARRVWAVHHDTGEPLWTHEGVPDDDSDVGWQDRTVPSLFSCAIHDSTVYAELGGRPISYYGYQPTGNQSLLTALDLETGEALWQVSPAQFEDNPREVQFEGPPLADASGVYILVRRRRAFGFEDCYLWKLSPEASLLWKVHLGSAATGGFGYRRPTLGLISQVDGSIYVQTNLGTVASVDDATGEVKWISVYNRQARGGRDTWQRSGTNRAFPWQYNPIFAVPGGTLSTSAGFAETSQGELVVLPLDTEELIVMDRRSGSIRHRVSTREIGDIDVLLGVVDGRLFGVGTAVVCWDVANREMVWTRPMVDSPLYGRGALSRTHLFIPTREGLAQVPIDGGEPLVTSWDPTFAGGNVVILGEQVLIAGNDHVTAFGHRERVFERLQARLDDRPSDPVPALELAEMAYRSATTQTDPELQSADYTAGRRALDMCISRAGGLAAGLPDDLRSRLFNDCLRFANQHLEAAPPRTDAAIDLLILAAQSAPDIGGLLTQKARLAGAYALAGQHDAELREYHHILGDRGLRDLPWPNATSTAATAAVACRQRIDALIEQHGRGLYKSFDELAATQLAAATQARNPHRLAQIAETFPNAAAAPKAWLARGNVLSEQDEALAAARSYYIGLTRYPDGVSRAETMRRIAECYADAKRPGAARAWLTRGARQFPESRVQHDGRWLSLASYRDTAPRFAGHRNIPRPQVGVRPTRGFELPVAASARWLYPRVTRHSDADWSRLLVADEQLTAYTPMTGQPLWSVPIPAPGCELLTALHDVIVLESPHTIVALDSTTGQVRWTIGGGHEQLQNPLADPEDLPRWSNVVVKDDHLIAVRSDRTARCLDIRSGEALWETRLEHDPTQISTLTTDHWIALTLRGEQQLVDIRARTTGGLIHRLEPEGKSQIVRIVPSAAGITMLCTTRGITAFDTLDGALLWRRHFKAPLQPHTVHTTTDGLYCATTGQHVFKLSIEDGTPLWTSERLRQQGGPLTVVADVDELYILTGRRLASLDPVTGRLIVEIAPKNHEVFAAELVEGHVVLYLQGEDRLWAAMTPRPMHGVDVEPIDLGPFEDSPTLRCYNEGIIGTGKGSLVGWVSPLR